ncbi:hypothetical protein EV421DRAFT_102692 [Armillaria borealis]|uniref:Uncharacterized protein n=1 Tax=Armillaria borealis TaxID=47425 RepID=A0AA39KBI7_9AGAR|nr:hypothetical protein EV421DRAFT_102692 [Armillaria borealis]
MTRVSLRLVIVISPYELALATRHSGSGDDDETGWLDIRVYMDRQRRDLDLIPSSMDIPTKFGAELSRHDVPEAFRPCSLPKCPNFVMCRGCFPYHFSTRDRRAWTKCIRTLMCCFFLRDQNKNSSFSSRASPVRIQGGLVLLLPLPFLRALDSSFPQYQSLGSFF